MDSIIKEYDEYLDSVIAELQQGFTGTALTNPSGLGAMSRTYNSHAVAKADEILNNKELSYLDKNALALKLKEAQAIKHGTLVTKFL